MQQYSDKRLKFLAEQKAAGINPYPHKFSSTMSITDFIKTYGELDNEDRVQDMQVSLAGTVEKSMNISFSFLFLLRGRGLCLGSYRLAISVMYVLCVLSFKGGS